MTNSELRVLSLALLALAIAWLVGCVIEEVPVSPVESPTPPMSPISPLPPLERELPLNLLGADIGAVSPLVTEVRPWWMAVAHLVEPGDLFLFECQLRRGGGQGVIASQPFTLRRGEWRELHWIVEDLDPGPYEVFCRAERDGRFWFELFDSDSQNCAEGCGFVFIEGWEVASSQ